ncbi:MAG: hypothetical protein ABFS24_03275 [Pseudomonadota bacterium]
MGIVQFHSKQSDLVLHVNDQVGDVQQRDIESALEENPGVVNVEFTENRPRLIHVSYDQDETSYIETLERLCSQNVHAQHMGD